MVKGIVLPYHQQMNSERRLFSGWDDNIAGMRPGSIRQLMVPSHLGFGAQDHGNIPADTVLVIGQSFFKDPKKSTLITGLRFYCRNCQRSEGRSNEGIIPDSYSCVIFSCIIHGKPPVNPLIIIISMYTLRAF